MSHFCIKNFVSFFFCMLGIFCLFVCKVFFLVFVSALFLYKSFWSCPTKIWQYFFVLKLFAYLRRIRRFFFSFTPLFYFFQDLVVHWVALTWYHDIYLTCYHIQEPIGSCLQLCSNLNVNLNIICIKQSLHILIMTTSVANDVKRNDKNFQLTF